LGLDVSMERADVVARLESLRDTNELAGLAFYAYRDLNRTEPEPFLKAALERCPVSIAACADMDEAAVVRAVQALADESIYDGPGRLAQPDEIWNYGRGDGAEKALLLANLLRPRHPTTPMSIEVTPDSAVLRLGESEASASERGAAERPDGALTCRFASKKGLRAQTWHCGPLSH
jgi:hypothetical protein